VLVGDDRLQLRSRRHGHPQPIQQPIAVERVPEDVRVVALEQDQRVLARRAQHDANGCRGKAAYGAAVGQQLVAMAQEQPVRGREASQDAIHVMRRIDDLVA